MTSVRLSSKLFLGACFLPPLFCDTKDTKYLSFPPCHIKYIMSLLQKR